MNFTLIKVNLENMFGSADAAKCIVSRKSGYRFSIEVPILNSERDYLDFDIEMVGSDAFRTTDNGVTLKNAKAHGVNYMEMNENWTIAFSRILNENSLSIDTENGSLSKEYPIAKLNEAVIFFPQALAAIDRFCASKLAYNSHHSVQKQTIDSRIENLFTSHNFKYTPAVPLKGKPGLKIKLDYHVTNPRNNHNIFVSILKKESDNRILLLEWNDLKSASITEDSNLLAIEEKPIKNEAQQRIRLLMQKAGIIVTSEADTEKTLERLVG